MCSPSPYRLEVFGREDESWRYWSLKMRYEEGSVGVVSKRVSPEERRRTVKPKGVVFLRSKVRSELGWESSSEEWR